MNPSIQRITFVWNADFSLAGGVRALREVVQGHHSCTLCAIAYHRITQTADWTAYKSELAQRLHAEIRQPCRNQLKRVEIAAAAGDFPTVLAHSRSGVIKLLGSDEIDACKGQLAPFRQKLDTAIARHLTPAPRKAKLKRRLAQTADSKRVRSAR